MYKVRIMFLCRFTFALSNSNKHIDVTKFSLLIFKNYTL
jgi:hypothetical protein